MAVDLGVRFLNVTKWRSSEGVMERETGQRVSLKWYGVAGTGATDVPFTTNPLPLRPSRMGTSLG